MAREFASGKTRIGWIGTGVMGTSMCGHLMAAGYQATVYNRSRSKTKALVDRGAKEADSPREVAEASNVIFTIVGYPQDVREVTLGANGTLEGARPDSVLVDMTTSEPTLAREIFEAAKAKGVHSIDAPVSGGDIGAREARLSIMIGGEPSIVAALQPLFQTMGKTIVHQGPAGAGQHTKMVNQILIATNMIGVCEALLYGFRAGLDLNQVMQSVASGAAGSWSLSNLGTRMIAGNFDPGFSVEHFLKDMAIALAESRRMKLALPGLALAEQLYRAVEAQGHVRKGTHALMLALAKMSNIDWKVASPWAGTSDSSPASSAGGGGNHEPSRSQSP
jgi:3-hydroxyisobutyrate dehydrogenase